MIPSAPVASVGIDTTGDGRANYIVSGVDRNRNGIPDALETTSTVPVLSAQPPSPNNRVYYQQPSTRAATIGVDTNGDGQANYYYTGVDQNRDGIPDALQTGSSFAAVDPTYRHVSPPRSAQVPQATIGIDSTGDGKANYYYTGVDRNRDGVPDALQPGTQARPLSPPNVRNVSTRTVSSPVAITRMPIANTTPMATVGLDTTGDGRANYVVTGEDRNLDGIPDVLQHGQGVRCVCGNLFMDDSNFCRKCGAARFATELITGNAVLTSDQRDGIICQMLGSGQVKVGFWKGLPEFKVYNISQVKKVPVVAARSDWQLEA